MLFNKSLFDFLLKSDIIIAMPSVVDNKLKKTGSDFINENQILQFETLFHVGTMNPEDRGIIYKYSYEGNGLSVSLDPDQWIRIAKLGGLPIWELANPGKTCFLDIHSLTNEQINEIKIWGEDLYDEVDCYLVAIYDECGEEHSIGFDTLKEAEQELNEGQCLDDIVVSTRLRASILLKEKVNIADRDCALDLVIVQWAEEHGFDGLWWEDEYGFLSCPRGVIFKDKVNDWRAKQICFSKKN
jgi:hypothetical protein